MEADLGKLFIGGISWDTNEERLRDYFKNYGEIVEAVIMKDRTTGRARGFGFIVFADPAVAERVVMEKHMIDGRMVEAKKAVPRDDQHILNRNSISVHSSPGPTRTKKIFVGGLASTVTEADFRKYFEQFGNINDVVVMYDHNTQRPRGFGFITYDSEDAVDKVLVKTFHELNGKMVEVKRAVPKELSPSPNIRSPVGGYNYGFSRVNNLFNGYTPGYNPSSIGGYGMRMDGRFGAVASGRNGFPLSPGYGIEMNFDPSMSPSYGGNSSYANSIAYGRGLNQYYGGNTSRYTSPIGFGGGSIGTGSVLNSMNRNVLGNSALGYSAISPRSNAYSASGTVSLGGFGSGLNWGSSSSPMSTHGVGTGSGYAGASLGYGGGENSFGLGTNNYGRTSGTGSVNTSFTASSGGFEGNYSELYGGSLVYGDSAWRSGSSDLDAPDPFAYGLGNSTSDTTTKGSAGYVGGYNVTNRQPNRSIIT